MANLYQLTYIIKLNFLQRVTSIQTKWDHSYHPLSNSRLDISTISIIFLDGMLIILNQIMTLNKNYSKLEAILSKSYG